MNVLILIISTLVLVGIEIVLSFYIKIGFIIIISVSLMGIFIILKNKTLSCICDFYFHIRGDTRFYAKPFLCFERYFNC